MLLRRREIVGFLCRFVCVYALLLAPWPGGDELYGAYFRAMGEMVFARESGNRIVLFEFHPVQHGFTTLNTRMTMGNRALVDSTGKGPAAMVELDTRSIGWVPTALTIALILASPIPWRRRALALLAGLILVHAFILLTIQAWIWNHAPDLSLATTTPFWSVVTDGLEYTLLTQLGASFSVPVLIWILVTFQRPDHEAKQPGGLTD